MTMRDEHHHERHLEPEDQRHGHGQQPSDTDDDRDLGFDLPEAAKVSPTRIVALGAVALAVIGAAFVIGWVPKHRSKQALETSTKEAENALLRVQVVTPKAKSSDRSLALPGSVQALQETTVFPRASGYVRSWAVDIGDKVKEGATLAEIDTPELDQQIDQARAQLAQAQAGLVQAKANHEFSVTNLDRYKLLTPKGVASQQELDKQQAQTLVDDANVKVAQANIEAQQANMRRLVQLKSFAHVTAPFGGTVNARLIERGALVSSSTPLFKISETDPVRVFVQVPQDVAPSVRSDVPAQVTVREYAGRTFQGKVARSAGALDPGSRTMNTEVRVDNPKNELLVGMYAQVSLTLPSPHRVYEIPGTAVLQDANGVRVATVVDGKLHLVPVTIERDTGTTMEISSGLNGSEHVVKLASAELVEGRGVEVATEPPKEGAPAPAKEPAKESK
ncbi:putative Co/Zn/Cd efflux system membrane fusion protein [Labilithrix luteola]|uniref:Putative Co/Zn/Cd efflux system membrane fusion protein n=2 Tax=Labilithrix luteola TaxID=1391654 RepID=A0A0K1PX94_9BACT|nr:putative Co/Zn/Cd efflux system membrane fusion protein [Labilithrix luteola]